MSQLTTVPSRCWIDWHTERTATIAMRMLMRRRKGKSKRSKDKEQMQSKWQEWNGKYSVWKQTKEICNHNLVTKRTRKIEREREKENSYNFASKHTFYGRYRKKGAASTMATMQKWETKSKRMGPTSAQSSCCSDLSVLCGRWVLFIISRVPCVRLLLLPSSSFFFFIVVVVFGYLSFQRWRAERCTHNVSNCPRVVNERSVVLFFFGTHNVCLQCLSGVYLHVSVYCTRNKRIEIR